MVVVFLSKKATKKVENSKKFIDETWEELELDSEMLNDSDRSNDTESLPSSSNEANANEDAEAYQPEPIPKKYSQASPFAQLFRAEKDAIVEKLAAVTEDSELPDNNFYCPQIITTLLEQAQFLPFFPLWSALFINSHLPKCDTGRLNQGPTEAHMRSYKHSLVQIKLGRRTVGAVIRDIQTATYGLTKKSLSAIVANQNVARKILKKVKLRRVQNL